MKYVKTFESYNGDETESLKKLLDAMMNLGSGIQKDIAKEKLSLMKQVKVKKVSDAIDKNAADIIRTSVRPKKKNCYENSLHAAEYLKAYDVKYCEGWIMIHGIPIDHAFNKVGDDYFDVTKEFALGGNPEEYTYVVLKDWDPDTALQIMANGPYKCYGDVFNKEYISKHPENIK